MNSVNQDFLMACNRDHVSVSDTSEESPVDMFRYIGQVVEHGGYMESRLPPNLYQGILSIVSKKEDYDIVEDEGFLWYGDTTNLWRTIVESVMRSEEENEQNDQLLEEREQLDYDGDQTFSLSDIVIDHQAMQYIYDRMSYAAPSPVE